MRILRVVRNGVIAVAAAVMVACVNVDDLVEPIDEPPVGGGPASSALSVLGLGAVSERYSAEVWSHGGWAYTTTWGVRAFNGRNSPGNAIKIWDVTGNAPVLRDSVIVSGAETLGDVQVTADGRLLIVPTEDAGSIVLFDLFDPRRPVQLSRFTNSRISAGVHTVEVQPVDGRLYAFLAIDPGFSSPARLVIVDINNPSSPFEVTSLQIGNPFMHDTFVRAGYLFTANWNAGTSIYDIGGGGRGSITSPFFVGRALTVGGSAHNVWWFHDPITGSRRYMIVGEENESSFAPSAGDIHVVDISDMANPREVAFFHVPGAGTHNFWMDEQRGLLYAAYYNAGVRVLDLRGDLGSCTSSQRSNDGRCDLGLMGRERARGLHNQDVFIWGVHGSNGRVYASDMLNGIWALEAVTQ